MREPEKSATGISSMTVMPRSRKVESFSAATGARFTLLPPDNATGNYTKIVQRLPVKVTIKDLPPGLMLRPGLSVDLTVDTRN